VIEEFCVVDWELDIWEDAISSTRDLRGTSSSNVFFNILLSLP